MRLRVVFLISIVLLIPTLALGQAETTGRISGSVSDEYAQPIVGAQVSPCSHRVTAQTGTKPPQVPHSAT